MSLQATVGNWTIEPMYNGSISEPKSLVIPDLDWATDYSSRTKPKDRQTPKRATEDYFGCNAVADFSVKNPEFVILGVQPVANIYNGTDVAPENRASQTGGHRTHMDVVHLYKATNSVSGQEIIFPIKGQMNFTVPDLPFVTEALVNEHVKRTVSHVYPTGSIDESLVVQQLRGDIDPTR